MENITLSKAKYEILRKKAFLYEEVFKALPKRIFGTEVYSEKRIKEFEQEDKLDKKTKNRLEKLLK